MSRLSYPVVISVLLALLVVGGRVEAAGAAPGKKRAAFPGRLHTTAKSIVDSRGREVLLRGFNVIPVFSAGGGTWSRRHYRRIRRRGFNVVRFVVYWSRMQPARGRFNRVALRTLDRAVRNARRAGLYVVLDPIHLFDGTRYVPRWARPTLSEQDRWDPTESGAALRRAVQDNAPRYLRMLARRYRHDRTVAAYDLVNEPPSYPPDQNGILRMFDSLIRAVREVDPSKIVMIEPSFGNSSMVGADLGLLRDKRNLVFSLHDYYAGGAGEGYRPTGERAYREEPDRIYDSAAAPELEAHLRVNLDVMRAAGIPVWIGEFGIDPANPSAARWIEDKVALFKKYRLGYAWWLYGPRKTGKGYNGYPTLRQDFRTFLRFVRRLL
ncbi:MAG TPA: cellulase family glycosylhydrolase [Thermoleophilaceae bacterium]|nr:cellulase family glycosylhydrolase [Thermoleophilaceae bacterium]